MDFIFQSLKLQLGFNTLPPKNIPRFFSCSKSAGLLKVQTLFITPINPNANLANIAGYMQVAEANNR